MMKQIAINRADLKPGDLVVTANTEDNWIYVQREMPDPKVGDRINTQEELESLPEFSAVLDIDNDVWQSRGRDWYMASDSGVGRSLHYLTTSSYGPFKIIHIAEEN